MANYTKDDDFRFDMMELSGSLGDLGLFIPLVVAMTLVCRLDLGLVLIVAGLMNIATGFLFRLPIPVQPMKAIAAVAITEGLLRSELWAAGILMGVILLMSSFVIDRVIQIVPKAVVRGIQFGVGTKLALKGLEWIGDLSFWGIDSVLMAMIMIMVLLFFLEKEKPVLLFVFIFGFILLFVQKPNLFTNVSVAWPAFGLYLPELAAYKGGFIRGVVPQLPLTLLNSVVAVCALSADYFPNKKVAPRKMATSVGLMNVIGIPLGGIPMCHGSGGLAAQYKFGARSGGSVIMLGAFKVVIGLFLGAAIFDLLQSYPISILGVLLIFAGLELAKAAKDCMGDSGDFAVIVTMSVFIIAMNTFIGFLVGVVLYLLFQLKERTVDG